MKQMFITTAFCPITVPCVRLRLASFGADRVGGSMPVPYCACAQRMC